jgi:hypothetical protein
MAEDEAMDLIKRKLASLSPVKVVVEKELMEYLHIITDGYCGALSWLTDELYKVCSMFLISMIASDRS